MTYYFRLLHFSCYWLLLTSIASSCDRFTRTTGTVINQATGLPLKGVEVVETKKEWHKILTDDSGHFEISTISGGLTKPQPLHLRFQKENFQSLEKELGSGDAVLISLAPLTPLPNHFLLTDSSYSISTRELQRSNLPDSVFLLLSLKHLSISGMDCDYGDHTHCWALGELPPAIGQLTQLETLSLTINNIPSLPLEIGKLNRLRELDLTDNPNLTDIEPVVLLPQLEVLNVFGCGLKQLPATIGRLKNLKQLGLTGNPLSATELARLKKELPGCRIIFAP